MASDELELKMSAMTNTLDEEVSLQGISSNYYEGVSGKRAREKADPDSGNLYEPQKRRIRKEDNVDATVAIRSDSSYQVTTTTDAARGTVLSYRCRNILTCPIQTATPGHFEMLSNDALIPTHHTTGASLPSHCDVDSSTTLSANGASFSAGGRDFLQYSLGGNETFVGGEYIGTLPRAPLLFSHTMDGSLNYTEHEYEPAKNARAPLLCSHTVDESSSLPAGHQYEATVLARAPLLASHTMDGSSSYETVCLYEQ